MTVVDDIYDKLRNGVKNMEKKFTTNDVVIEFSRMYPSDYRLLVRKYGKGGAGAGKWYSTRNYIGLTLLRLSRQPNTPIEFLDFIDAPSDINWGNAVIAWWKRK